MLEIPNTYNPTDDILTWLEDSISMDISRLHYMEKIKQETDDNRLKNLIKYYENYIEERFDKNLFVHVIKKSEFYYYKNGLDKESLNIINQGWTNKGIE